MTTKSKKFQYLNQNDNMDTLIEKMIDDCEEAKEIVELIWQERDVNIFIRLDEAKQTGQKLVNLYNLCGSVKRMKEILYGHCGKEDNSSSVS